MHTCTNCYKLLYTNVLLNNYKYKLKHLLKSFDRRCRSSDIIDDGNKKSSLLSLEKEHISISPKVGVVVAY